MEARLLPLPAGAGMHKEPNQMFNSSAQAMIARHALGYAILSIMALALLP
jgi:hypothetical protein